MSDVILGQPALDEPASKATEPRNAESFTLREALFQRRIRPGSLIALVAAVAVIAAGSAAAGVALGSRTIPAPAPAGTRLTVTEPAVERPAGSVADIAARVLPSVVSLEVAVGRTGESGSGIVIDPAGYILTNDHVVKMAGDSAAHLTVIFNDDVSTRAPATVVATDPATDLAVVKVDGVADLNVAALGDSDTVQVGDTVIAIGSPLGLDGTVTTGIISAVHRPVRLGPVGDSADAVIDAIQTDAAVNPGNSGGPLVDASGTIIGINTAIRTLSGDATSSGSIGLGFAIPINDARTVAEALIAGEPLVRPNLGVNARSATDGGIIGAQLQNVVDGGSAAKAGLQEGDVVLSVDGRLVRSADELAVSIQRHLVGDEVEVAVLRDGRTLTVHVTLQAD